MLDKKNFYINGQWVKPNSAEEIKVIDPATEENCAVITLGNKADVDLAVSAAKDAYESWAFLIKRRKNWIIRKIIRKL
jgi:aldehyde dehydrogenase (NAD+)